ncbi:MAG: plasma-membrane proton-efflux P-type ATPase [Desulfobulbales bacterium]
MSANYKQKEEDKDKTVDQILLELKVDRTKGLSEEDAAKRLEEFGYNQITEKKTSPFLKFLGYFWGPIPWMIEVAAILSAVIRHWEDFWIIFALLVLNAIIGFWQEHKADNAIELLKKKLALNCHVKRNGKWESKPARELVPGDVVRVRLGEIVPADIKLFEGDYLSVDESALTGESLPVDKQREDLAYAGSIIRQGEMDAVVVATGLNSFFGKTTKLVAEAKTESHFQKAVIKVGDYLIVLAAIMVAIIFVTAVFRHESLVMTLQFALVLTVAAIPVALPAVLSVTMAVGATMLARKQAIVSKLVAIEEMAGMDVLCSDKTGTITKNQLTISEVQPFGEFTDNEVLLYAGLASRAEDQDIIDTTIINKAQSIQWVKEQLNIYTIGKFSPFDPVSKRTEATASTGNDPSFQISKGAPQVILDLIPDTKSMAEEVAKTVDDFAARGYRALGVAKTDSAGSWQFVGLVPFYDPPRDDSAATIKTAQNMGISVKMVTGDHAAISREIAQQVNLGTNIQSASSFLNVQDRQAKRIVEEADGFSQVFPEHKYHIVELLQLKGHIVGMTGDGVNDAPALKKADAGIAVEGATDAAKSAADIVLTNPGLSVVISAIKISRQIFQRMNSYAIYRIAETIRVLLFITLSIIIFNFYPVTAIMIVLLALFNDAPIMAIAYDNVRYSSTPEKWNMRVVLGMSTLLGVAGVFFSFLIFYIGRDILHLSRDMVQSFIFLKLAVAGHLTIFLTRTRGPFWSIKPSPVLFWSAVITKILATLVAVYGWYVAPIGWKLALIVWGYALVAFFLTDFIKVWFYKVLDHGGMYFKK